MKALITGVAGFLGSNLAEYLLEQGHDVLGVDDLSAGDLENIPDGVKFWAEDCRDLARHLPGVEVVYHCAAHPHEGLSVFSPHAIGESIYGPSVAVFSACVSRGVKRVVYCSSMSRYGANPLPFTETQPTAPVDPYAIAKVAAEDTLRALGRAHGLEYVIAVPHNIIGKNQKYDDPFRNVAAIMANRMLLGEQPIVYGDGRQTRCFSDVRDVVGILARLGWEDCNREAFNVGPDEQVVTIEELGRLIADVIGCQWKPKRLPDRPLEVKHAHCSSDKIRSKFGYSTRYSLRETIESLVDHISARGPKAFDYYLPLEIVTDKTPTFWLENENPPHRLRA